MTNRSRKSARNDSSKLKREIGTKTAIPQTILVGIGWAREWPPEVILPGGSPSMQCEPLNTSSIMNRQDTESNRNNSIEHETGRIPYDIMPRMTELVGLLRLDNWLI